MEDDEHVEKQKISIWVFIINDWFVAFAIAAICIAIFEPPQWVLVIMLAVFGSWFVFIIAAGLVRSAIITARDL